MDPTAIIFELMPFSPLPPSWQTIPPPVQSSSGLVVCVVTTEFAVGEHEDAPEANSLLWDLVVCGSFHKKHM
jgi:hypothetical protein